MRVSLGMSVIEVTSTSFNSRPYSPDSLQLQRNQREADHEATGERTNNRGEEVLRKHEHLGRIVIVMMASGLRDDVPVAMDGRSKAADIAPRCRDPDKCNGFDSIQPSQAHHDAHGYN